MGWRNHRPENVVTSRPDFAAYKKMKEILYRKRFERTQLFMKSIISFWDELVKV